MRSIEAMLSTYFIKTSFAITFSQILPSWLEPMLTKGSYSQDGSDTNSVGTPDYPSWIPDMHTIHDPMISVSWIHISELITELHHPLQYQNKVLQLVTWLRLIMPRRASLQLSSGYQAALMTHVMPTTLQAIWLGDVPSSHQRRHTHHCLQLKSSSRSDQVKSQGQSREYILELYSQTN
jgi:hypothetical protein